MLKNNCRFHLPDIPISLIVLMLACTFVCTSVYRYTMNGKIACGYAPSIGNLYTTEDIALPWKIFIFPTANRKFHLKNVIS